ALGDSHTCGRKTDGTLWCWGFNLDGEVGDGTTTNQTTPVQIGAGTLGNAMAEVEGGARHSCARKTDNTLGCWGVNGVGELGDGTNVSKPSPVQAGAGTLGGAVAEVALGYSHTCARKIDGTLWCWGDNSSGQLGDGTTVNKSSPVQIGAGTLGSAVAEVALGSYHTCARKTDGTLWCWGYNTSGELGDGTT